MLRAATATSPHPCAQGSYCLPTSPLCSGQLLAPPPLCAQGSYWYLDTRGEELLNMGGEWAGLQALAANVDKLVKGDGSKGEQSCG